LIVVVRIVHPSKLEWVSNDQLVRRYEPGDWDAWLRMSLALFPDQSADEAARGMRAFLAREDSVLLIALRPDGSVCGFVEANSRPYADGCETSPVGYVEAWYVDPDVRRHGYGRALLAAAEEWARTRGYQEMASDTQLDNDVSRQAHTRSGYAEVDRVIQFRKPLR
ncbi:MAG: aminoglycoside 6'-N-acetyltransferase, partial [Gemmatimonadota bacterium]